MKIVLFLCSASFLVFAADNAFAESCSDVIRLAAIESSNVQDEEDWRSDASAFCEAVSQAKSSGKTTSGNLGFKGFEAGSSSSRISTSVTASQICDSSSSQGLRKGAYNSYVRSIAPEAFNAYQTCQKLRSPMRVSVQADGENEAQLRIGYASTTLGAEGQITVTTSSEIKCNFGDARVFKTGQSATVECSRADSSRKGFITVNDITDASTTAVLTLPWIAYQDGVPVSLANRYTASISREDELSQRTHDLNKRVSHLENAIKVVNSSPRILSSFIIINGKLSAHSGGVEYDGKEGILSFPNPDDLQYSIALSDIRPGSGGYITDTHFVHDIMSREKVRIWRTGLNTGSANAAPHYVTGVIVSIPQKEQ